MRRHALAVSLAGGAVCLGAAGVAAASPPLRILYSGDWSGRHQIYALDAGHPSNIAQVTFGSAPGCRSDYPCGFDDPQPSPDGSRILFWATGEGGCTPGFFVARADGRGRRRFERADCLLRSAAWTPDSRRIAYVAPDGVHVVQSDGSRDRLVGPDLLPGGLAWSRDGRVLAFTYRGTVFVARTGAAVGRMQSYRFALSPDGNWLAYDGRDSHVHVERTDGSDDRALETDGGYGYSFSADGRYLAVDSVDAHALRVINVAARTMRTFEAPAISRPTWAPRGTRLAFRSRGGISIADARSGAVRRVGPTTDADVTWAPGGEAVVYLSSVVSGWEGGHEVNLATPTGRVRTILRGTDRFGGSIRNVTSTSPPAGVRYRRPAVRTAATVTAHQLVAPWPITALATDANRVAYETCGHVFTWTAGARSVSQLDPVASLAPWCGTPGYYLAFGVYSLALAGDRVAYAWRQGNAGRTWAVMSRTTATGRPTAPLDIQRGAGGGIGASLYGLGDIVGSGSLLVYSRWRETRDDPRTKITEQSIVRLDSESRAPVANANGPLLPLDVDAGRIAVARTGALQILDRNGAELLSVPVDALAAALSGRDLVALVQGGLRHYDATTGQLLRSWPLPDVPSGFRCGTPSGYRCSAVRLVLDDAARGLAVYVLDGEIHVLRLIDGADRVVARGTLARFLDAGLVYAEASTLRLVPFEQLPLRGF